MTRLLDSFSVALERKDFNFLLTSSFSIIAQKYRIDLRVYTKYMIVSTARRNVSEVVRIQKKITDFY